MYEVKTYKDGNAIKIMTKPCADDKRRYMYRVIDCSTGEQQWVEKTWLFNNREQIKNLGMSGVNLRAKAESQTDKCANLNFEPQYVVMYDVRQFIDKNLGEILCNMGIYPVAVQPAKKRDEYQYYCNILEPKGMSARELEKGKLAVGHLFKVRKLTDNSCEMAIEFNLSILYDYTVMLNARWGVEQKFMCKEYKLGLVNTVKGTRGKVKYELYRQFYDDSLYIDAQCVKQILEFVYQKLKEFILENRESIKATLYLPDGERRIPWVEVDVMENMHCPDGKSVIRKAYKYEGKGFAVNVNGVVVTARDLEDRCKMETRTSSVFSNKGYSIICEYIDKPNRVYYVKLGDVQGFSTY